jgi:hypothetical protein
MPKTVFRVKLRLVRPNTDIPFYGSMPGIENAKARYKLEGKILCNIIEISGDGLTRAVQIDFSNEETRNYFRQLPEVEEGMKGLYMYNSINNIVTYVDEELLTTTDYD